MTDKEKEKETFAFQVAQRITQTNTTLMNLWRPRKGQAVVCFVRGQGYIQGKVETDGSAETKRYVVESVTGNLVTTVGSSGSGLVPFLSLFPDLRSETRDATAQQLRPGMYLWRVSSIDSARTPVSALVYVERVHSGDETFEFSFVLDNQETNHFTAPFSSLALGTQALADMFPEAHFLPAAHIDRSHHAQLHPKTMGSSAAQPPGHHYHHHLHESESAAETEPGAVSVSYATSEPHEREQAKTKETPRWLALLESMRALSF